MVDRDASDSTINIARFALSEAQQALEALRSDTSMLATIAAAGKALADAMANGNRVFSCGNGGSMCDAMHFAEELSGRFRSDRPPLAAQAISDDKARAQALLDVINEINYFTQKSNDAQ